MDLTRKSGPPGLAENDDGKEVDAVVGGEAPRQGESVNEMSYAEIASKLIDLRGVGRPPTFSGKEEDWADFKFRMESAGSLLGLECVMEGPEKPLSPEETIKAKFLYNLLVQVCEGRGLLLIRQVRRADGAAAWRRLRMEYEPDVASRHCAVLAGLLSPQWSATGSFLDQLYAWERSVLDYEAATGVPLPDPVRCAVVQSWAPVPVREFLRLTPLELTQDYGQLRNALTQYAARGRVYDATGLVVPRKDTGGPVSMEVDAVLAKWNGGKGGGGGKGAGKGGGRGGFTGKCNYCGIVGHKEVDCRKKGGGARAGAGGVCRKCGSWKHYARDCPGVPKSGGGKGKGKGGPAGGGKGQVKGKCFNCGIVGHRAAECRKARLQAVCDEQVENTYAVEEESTAPYVVVISEPEENVIASMPAGVDTMLLMDSGSCVHACPKEFAKWFGLDPQAKKVTATTADGTVIEDYVRVQ